MVTKIKTKLLFIFFIIQALTRVFGSEEKTDWVGTWAASVQPMKKELIINQQTLRQVVRVSLGGNLFRIKFSNLFGSSPLLLGGAHLGIHQKESNILSGSDRAITILGEKEFTIGAGEELWSDPVSLEIPNLSEVVISLYFPRPSVQHTFHSVASQTTFISSAGNFLDVAEMPIQAKTQSWYVISGISVKSNASALVTMGDSITDGVCSSNNANARWPDFFANRIFNEDNAFKVSVLNQGIGFNMLLKDQGDLNQPSLSALKRFERDILNQPGVKYIVVLEGINDLGFSSASASTEEVAKSIIAAYQEMIDLAHKEGLIILGGTLTPIGSSGYDSLKNRETRNLINSFIRSTSHFDGFIDFDAALRDPTNTEKILSQYDCGDHLHPNSNGYQAMAQSIDLTGLPFLRK